MGVLYTMSSQARWKGLINAVSKESTDVLKIYKNKCSLTVSFESYKTFLLESCHVSKRFWDQNE